MGEFYGFVYITTNMINGKKYLGQKKPFKNMGVKISAETSFTFVALLRNSMKQSES